MEFPLKRCTSWWTLDTDADFSIVRICDRSFIAAVGGAAQQGLSSASSPAAANTTDSGKVSYGADMLETLKGRRSHGLIVR